MLRRSRGDASGGPGRARGCLLRPARGRDGRMGRHANLRGREGAKALIESGAEARPLWARTHDRATRARAEAAAPARANVRSEPAYLDVYSGRRGELAAAPDEALRCTSSGHPAPERRHTRHLRRHSPCRHAAPARSAGTVYFIECRNAITSARSFSFLNPGNAMLVPLMYFFGLAR